MNLQRRKFLRQAQQGGAGLALGAFASATWMAALHLPAQAGNQAEEELSDSVRTALSQAVQQSGPPVPVLPTSRDQEEFNAWYNTEHLPGLSRVPGTIRAQRYLRLSGSPRYIACYELLSPAVMESQEWLAIRHTAWSSRIRPMFMNTVRQLFIRHTSQAPT